MKILFDTNIILDLLLNRKPFVETSTNLVNFVETNAIEGYLCATTFTTIEYLVSKSTSRAKSKVAISNLLKIFNVAEVNKDVLESSFNSKLSDFEDAVQLYSGLNSGVVGLVTRNIKDYKNATELAIYSPEELWAILQLS